MSVVGNAIRQWVRIYGRISALAVRCCEDGRRLATARIGPPRRGLSLCNMTRWTIYHPTEIEPLYLTYDRYATGRHLNGFPVRPLRCGPCAFQTPRSAEVLRHAWDCMGHGEGSWANTDIPVKLKEDIVSILNVDICSVRQVSTPGQIQITVGANAAGGHIGHNQPVTRSA